MKWTCRSHPSPPRSNHCLLRRAGATAGAKRAWDGQQVVIACDTAGWLQRRIDSGTALTHTQARRGDLGKLRLGKLSSRADLMKMPAEWDAGAGRPAGSPPRRSGRRAGGVVGLSSGTGLGRPWALAAC